MYQPYVHNIPTTANHQWHQTGAPGAGFLLTVAAGELSFFFSDLHEHVMQDTGATEVAWNGPEHPEVYAVKGNSM